MSLWQHKNIHKKHLLWSKLFGLCLLLHLIFLFWIFCVYRDNSYMLSISVHKNLDYSTPIMFVPLGIATQATKAPVAKIANNNSKAASIKKPAPQKTTLAAVKPVASPKAPIVDTKKPVTVAAAPQKTTPPVKQEVAKVEPKKIEPKAEEVKKIEPPQKVAAIETPQPAQTKEVTQPPIAQALDIEQTVVPFVPENAHISHNYREVEALRRGAQLQKELVQKWKPPIGVSPDCMCEISFFVTTTGKIENLKMAKSSGVMMYDISARQALSAMTMPQWTHGKPLTINFKQ